MLQVIQIPLQFFHGSANPGGTGDDAHTVRNLDLIQDIAQLDALVAFDAARNATTARIVRHQHQVTAGEADEGRQRCALVAALVLIDLDNELLTFFENALNARTGKLAVLAF